MWLHFMKPRMPLGFSSMQYSQVCVAVRFWRSDSCSYQKVRYKVWGYMASRTKEKIIRVNKKLCMKSRYHAATKNKNKNKNKIEQLWWLSDEWLRHTAVRPCSPPKVGKRQYDVALDNDSHVEIKYENTWVLPGCQSACLAF